MASIVKRNNRYCVVYTYKHTNGTLKQKWETFTDLADAKNRKKEVEYKESVGTFVAPQCRTLKDLLKEYVTLYNGTAEGGFTDDKKRSNQSIFLQKCTARDRGTDLALYLQIRLHKERRT